MPRRPFVGGNWKSNGSVESAKTLCAALSSGSVAYRNKVEVVICPIAPHINLVSKLLRKSPIKVAAQNVSASAEGAFTGEISPGQLKDSRIEWTLIGHSERRSKFGETDAITATKIEQCQKASISVIFCIGELLEEREAGKTDEVNKRQLDAVYSQIEDWKKIVIAYEPVWAIGTGKVATPEQAQDAHAAIRKMIASAVSEEVANGVRILYGGSVTPENCKELITKPDIDGFLVGGASLKPTFTDIITACVPPPILKKPKFVKVDGISPAAKGVNLFGKVVSAATKVDASDDLMEVLVGDETGAVTLSIRGDRAKDCEVGMTVRVQNAHVAMIKGFIRLAVDKWSALKPADAEDTVASVNESKNISAVEYELTNS
mmetsp:Transcript_63061/g.205788  ORF Transcript_63061/g.205788 Transcript_63061/m.205788 type:complete len:375 (-) Transcript_63061:187-1311(-)